MEKYREGSKTIKKHDSPKTPLQRLLDSNHIDQSVKNNLKNQFDQLNPFQLQKQMKQKIDAIIDLVNKA